MFGLVGTRENLAGTDTGVDKAGALEYEFPVSVLE
jgi:hypothetical protein